jgi:hypothetical protein
VIVLVVLLEDRIEVSEVLVLVLVAGNDDAEGDFLVLADLVLLLVLELFLQDDLFHLLYRVLKRLSDG